VINSPSITYILSTYVIVDTAHVQHLLDLLVTCQSTSVLKYNAVLHLTIINKYIAWNLKAKGI